MKDAEGMVSADTSVRVALDLAEAEVRRERARCLAWADWLADQPLEYIGTGEYVARTDELFDGIEGGEWPPEEG